MKEISYSEITLVLEKKDELLSRVIQSNEKELHPTPSVDTYFFLLKSIVSQQLSLKAAATIWQRFLDLFPEEFPSEKEVLNLSTEELRAVGLSRQKASYLQNVATFSLEKGMSFDVLNTKSDAEIIKYLTEIKGVGKWTVQMMLMFPMDRPDVFPIDDLGVQTKIIQFYGLVGDKKELRNQMIAISENWKPFRSLASKFLWGAVFKEA